MRILVTSTNPAKIDAVTNAFTKAFPGQKLDISGQQAVSGVSAQPKTDEETKQGAINRVNNAHKTTSADYFVGLEGGIDRVGESIHSFAWISVLHQDQLSVCRSTTFPLPQKVVDIIDSGKELGEAMDIVYERHNSKQAEGAVGILTGGLVTRSQLYEQALLLALISFLEKSSNVAK